MKSPTSPTNNWVRWGVGWRTPALDAPSLLPDGREQLLFSRADEAAVLSAAASLLVSGRSLGPPPTVGAARFDAGPLFRLSLVTCSGKDAALARSGSSPIVPGLPPRSW